MKLRTNFMYRPFHKTLPRPSAFVNWISETDCTIPPEGRHHKKTLISYGPVRKRGGGKPPGHNQNRCLFSEKEKKMQNVLKWKNIQTYFVTFLQGLKHFSDIFIKHIFPLEPIFFSFIKNIHFRPFCIF